MFKELVVSGAVLATFLLQRLEWEALAVVGMVLNGLNQIADSVESLVFYQLLQALVTVASPLDDLLVELPTKELIHED